MMQLQLGSPFRGKLEQCIGRDSHVCCLPRLGCRVRDMLVYLETGPPGRVWSCVFCDERDYTDCNDLANVSFLKGQRKALASGGGGFIPKMPSLKTLFQEKSNVQLFKSLQEVPQLSARSATDRSRRQHWAVRPY